MFDYDLYKSRCKDLVCMQDSFARARTRPSARATIGYLVYKDLVSAI